MARLTRSSSCSGVRAAADAVPSEAGRDDAYHATVAAAADDMLCSMPNLGLDSDLGPRTRLRFLSMEVDSPFR